MAKKTSAPDLQLVQELLALVCDSDAASVDSGVPPTLYVPSVRLLKKTPTDVSVDSQGFPQMLQDASPKPAAASSASSEPQAPARSLKRKMTEVDAEGFYGGLDEDFDYLMLETIQHMCDMDELEDKERASFAAGQAEPKVQAPAGQPKAQPKAKSRPKAKSSPMAKAKSSPRAKAKVQPQSKAQAQPQTDDVKFAVGYLAMTYPTGACALRETTGAKKQLFQINSATKSKDQLWAILKEASKKLASGEETEVVKTWAKGQAAQ